MAGCYMPGLKVLTDRMSTKAPRARAVAFYTACFSGGTAVSYALAGIALEWFGWRGAFLLAAAGSVLAVIAVAALVVPQKPEAAKQVRSHLLDFRPVLRSRKTMSFVVGYAGHGAELFAMRSWVVPFLVFCLGSSSEFTLNATLLAAVTSLVAVASSIGGAGVGAAGRARAPDCMGDGGNIPAQRHRRLFVPAALCCRGNSVPRLFCRNPSRLGGAHTPGPSTPPR